MASYNIFNYNHRPAKSIERKIFVELLKEIYGVSPGKDCTYIGLGSVFFTDFKLIHKELGIENLINIEENIDDKKRFEFNRPFSCIKLKWGRTCDILPLENWTGKKIVWLDYETSLREYMFEDLETFIINAQPESFYLMSCNSKLERYTTNDGVHKLDKFKADYEDYLPDDISSLDLTNKHSAALIHSMFTLSINSFIDMRNAALNEDDKVIFHQLIYLTYQDGAPMMTMGGFLLKKSNYKKFLNYKLQNLSYVRTGNISLNLFSPIVTNQELDLMNNYLPRSQKNFLNLKKIDFIPRDERVKYQSTYRYYPNYAEISS